MVGGPDVDAAVQDARRCLHSSCSYYSIGSGMDLKYAAQGPLHRWSIVRNIVNGTLYSEDDDCAFLDVVYTLVPFVAVHQFIEIIRMPAVLKMFDLLDMLPSGEPVGWSVSEISLPQTP